MKTLKQLLEKKADLPQLSSPVEPTSVTSYVPKTKDEKRFMDKHVVKKTEDRAGNGDDHFRATNVKAYDRSASHHGYNTGEDQKVYESKTLSAILGERHMTPAEKKKREEIAQGIEKSNPGMPMSKKMAIATSKAMNESESSSAAYDKHVAACTKAMDDINKAIGQHGKHVRTKTDYHSGEPQWHHADHMKGVHRTLQDIHQSLQQTNDWTAPPKPVKVKEGFELFDVFAEDVRENVVTVFESLSEENQQTMIEMIEDQDLDTVVEIVKEIVNG